jgi:hypothetical protein
VPLKKEESKLMGRKRTLSDMLDMFFRKNNMKCLEYIAEARNQGSS